MITIQSRVYVDGINGQKLADFLLGCTDQAYQAWWPGTHLRLHTVRRYPNHVGNVVLMDEFIGKRRVKMVGVVRVARPDRIVWQLKKGSLLPVRLILELGDDAAGVAITHTIQAGFRGLGHLFDPVFRLYFSDQFARAIDQHVRVEFPMLRDLLRRSDQSTPVGV